MPPSTRRRNATPKTTQSMFVLMTLTRPVSTDPFPPTEPWQGKIFGRRKDKQDMQDWMTELKNAHKSGSFWTFKSGEHTVANGGAPLKDFKPVIGRDVIDGEKVWRLYWVERREEEPTSE